MNSVFNFLLVSFLSFNVWAQSKLIDGSGGSVSTLSFNNQDHKTCYQELTGAAPHLLVSADFIYTRAYDFCKKQTDKGYISKVTQCMKTYNDLGGRLDSNGGRDYDFFADCQNESRQQHLMNIAPAVKVCMDYMTAITEPVYKEKIFNKISMYKQVANLPGGPCDSFELAKELIAQVREKLSDTVSASILATRLREAKKLVAIGNQNFQTKISELERKSQDKVKTVDILNDLLTTFRLQPEPVLVQRERVQTLLADGSEGTVTSRQAFMICHILDGAILSAYGKKIVGDLEKDSKPYATIRWLFPYIVDNGSAERTDEQLALYSDYHTRAYLVSRDPDQCEQHDFQYRPYEDKKFTEHMESWVQTQEYQ